jgi:hypothetical protein
MIVRRVIACDRRQDRSLVSRPEQLSGNPASETQAKRVANYAKKKDLYEAFLLTLADSSLNINGL